MLWRPPDYSLWVRLRVLMTFAIVINDQVYFTEIHSQKNNLSLGYDND